MAIKEDIVENGVRYILSHGEWRAQFTDWRRGLVYGYGRTRVIALAILQRRWEAHLALGRSMRRQAGYG